MPSPDLSELLQSAAPAPRMALDIGPIERRAHRRRRRRRVASAGACVAAVGLLITAVVRLPDSGEHKTLVAGPPSSRPIPVEFHGDVAITEIHLLDGTRLRLTLPDAVGRDLAGTTLADLELHGAVYAGPAPHGWRIDVLAGSIGLQIPGGKAIAVPPSSGASAAILDRPGRRLGVQFGSWAVVATTGESLTGDDIANILTGVAVAEGPAGFVEYHGSLPLWTVDAADARLNGPQTAVSVFLSTANCSLDAYPRVTPGGLDAYRLNQPVKSPGATQLCDNVHRLRILVQTPAPLTDDEIDLIRVDVVSVGSTFAALQRGEHP